tara:strand:+ start:2420 stop:3271 length:852 start_codon:yes stop_codon:yes gene_type:complete
MNIAAVIVLYKHDNNIIELSISKIEKHIKKFFIINNFKDAFLSESITNNDKVDVIENSSNIGISAGYNIGLKKAIEEGCSFAFLLDQDSIASKELIPSITSHMPENAALISSCYEEYTNYKNIKFKKSSNSNVLELVEFNIGSGSLISLDKLSHIGLFDETFFMEHYDIEWCFRARRKGFFIYKTNDYLFFHKIGINRKILFGQAINIHEPIRYYYKSWGLIRLIYNKNMPWIWKFKELLKYLVKLIVFPVLSNNFFRTLKFMILGMYDGIRKVQRKSLQKKL